MRQALSADAGPIFFEDTDIIQTAIWEQHLLGNNSSEMLAMVSNDQAADYYLLLAPTVPFEQDGGRYYADLKTRERFFDMALSMVQKTKKPYGIIDQKEWAAREEAAHVAIQEFIRETFKV